MKAITIAGNIGRDAVVRTTGQGKKVAGFSVAVDDGFGESKRTLWFDCAIWGERGEKMAPHLTKGSKITVSGDLSTREHEGRTYLTVRVNELDFHGGGQQRQSYEDPQAPLGGHGGGRGDLDDPDSIPF